MIPLTSVSRTVRIVFLIVALLALVGCGVPGNVGTIPTAPTDVVATAGPGSITVSWTDTSDDEIGFTVLRATDGDFSEIATVPADTNTYLDATATEAFPSSYRVSAIGTGGSSDASAASVPVRPNPEGVPPVDPNDPVGVRLNQLGIDTTATPRLGDDGEPLPGTYSPLGATTTLGADGRAGAQYELFIGGAAAPAGVGASNQVVWEAGDADAPQNTQPMHGLDSEIFDLGSTSPDLYRAAAGDFDGDGLDEFVMVSMIGIDDADLTVQIVDDAVAGYSDEQIFVTGRPGLQVQTLSVVAGDFDGDGTDTLALALNTPGRAELLFLATWADGFAVDRARVFASSVEGASTQLALASGSLDDDPGHELAVVINESFENAKGEEDGVSRYAILDDATNAYTILSEGSVQGQDGAVYTAKVADVAIGDIDGDGRGEVVLGGIPEFHQTCTGYDLLYVALEDAMGIDDPAAGALEPLGARVRTVSMGGACSAGAVKRLRYIHVETGDVDGDGVDEIVGGPMVFDDWSAPWMELGWIPGAQMYGDENVATVVGRLNSALAVTDMDGDGSSEIVHYLARDAAVKRYVLPETAGDPLQQLGSWAVDLGFNQNGSRYRPMLIAANIDQDSMVARAIPERTRFTMTEPILVAALAAAPCNADISQNLGACTTAYGEGESSGVATGQTVTLSASVSIGMKAIGGALTQSELTAKGTFFANASYVRSRSYTLERQVVYSTGPLEDAVIFTAVPYDQFVYEILQHPDPGMIGAEAEVNLPREPVTLLVERSYFNDAQTEGNLKIDATIFRHTVGDPATYLGPAERDRLLDDLLFRYGRESLMNGPVSVGQGGGATEVSLQVSDEISNGGALEIGFEYEVEAVGASVLAGFSVGVSAEASLSWTSGTSTTYVGSVGNIADPTEFARDGYRYGIFTYVHEDEASGQQFEVINYWVD